MLQRQLASTALRVPCISAHSANAPASSRGLFTVIHQGFEAYRLLLGQNPVKSVFYLFHV